MPGIILLCWLCPGPARAEIHSDTIGWTDRDRQFLGPAVRYLTGDPARGLHAIYKSGYGEIHYNYKPRGEDWRFRTGVVVNPYQRNLGCLDYDITTGAALISSDYLFKGKRIISFFADSTCGAARFREADIAIGPQFNLIAAVRYGYLKFAAIKNDTLYYYSQWSKRNLGLCGPFALHNLIASKISSRLGFIWTEFSSKKLYFRETPDGGGTWYQTRSLSDSVPSSTNRSLFGANAVYDSIQPHLVCDFSDGTNRAQIQLWHYCQYQQPSWSLITSFDFSDTTQLGLHTAALDRPSIGIDRKKTSSDQNRLYVVWEQFDPNNIDPQTGIARADIWASSSPDNGRTWTRPIRLTRPDASSKRFPYLAETVNDTLHILYFADQIAGSWELGEGEKTQNPVIYLRVPAEIFTSDIVESPPKPLQRYHYPTIITTRNKNHPLSPTPKCQQPCSYRCQRHHLQACKGKILDPLGRAHPLADLTDLPTGSYFSLTPIYQSRNPFYLNRTIKIK
ncbi:MAG: hypothetical protein ACUVUR_01005 [bacterium]